MVSYEVSIGLIMLNIVLCSSSMNLTEIILSQQDCWYVIPLYPLFLMFFISILAETNRPPFDLPEAEGELVAGYFVEYSAMGFGLFFIGENANIILMSFFTVILFFGGWQIMPLVNLLVLTLLTLCYLLVVVGINYNQFNFELILFLLFVSCLIPTFFVIGLKVLFIIFLFI